MLQRVHDRLVTQFDYIVTHLNRIVAYLSRFVTHLLRVAARLALAVRARAEAASAGRRSLHACVRICLALALVAAWQLYPVASPVSHAVSTSALSFDGLGSYVEVPNSSSLA